MYINRIADEILPEMFSRRKIIILLGARQVGKTTLIGQFTVAKKTTTLNLDIEVDKQTFLAASVLPPSDAALRLGAPEILVIDEAQRLPEVGRIVKGWYDAKIPMAIILLGSSSLEILNSSAESLTGRNVKLFLPPLLFRETLRVNSWYSDLDTEDNFLSIFGPQTAEYLLERIVFGSYPEAVLSADKTDYLRNLTADYLFKDVYQMALVREPDMLKRLLTLLAHQVGAEVSIHELSRALGLARPTITRYLDLLEQTYVIFRLPSFSTNLRNEVARGRKIYFWDTGVRNAVLNEFSLRPTRPDIGALWENWVIAECAKLNALTGARRDMFFWRTKDGSEVDLILRDEKGQLSAYEIKWRKEGGRGRAFSERYKAPVQTLTSRNPLFDVQLFPESRERFARLGRPPDGAGVC